MTLAGRLSTIYLGALAVVLAGFSFALQWLASEYLDRRENERLEAAVRTLIAAAEVDERGVEWEPAERRLGFGRHAPEGRFYWQVRDPRGTLLDGSPPDDGSPPPPGAGTRAIARTFDRDGRPWRVLRRVLARPDPPGGGPPLAPAPGKYESLEIVAGVSTEGVRDTLRTLALSSAGLSIGLWTLALIAGRLLSRRALRPVARMAEAAHAIAGDRPGDRLPLPRSRDELHGLGAAFNALLDRLQEAFERQRRFTGDASHQLRTPLTAIQGQVDLALRQDRDIATYQQTLAVVRKRTRHLRQIVDALLFLARADADARLPDLEPIALDAWLAEHLRARPEATTGPPVRVETAPGGPFVALAQPALLGELVENLLENAAKYGPPGAPIIARLAREDDEVLLAVEDCGPGIPEADLPRLFEPFYRADDARRRGTPGLGLGLSVALRLARLFGGTIEARSRPGLGSTFILRLPADVDGSTIADRSGREPS